MIIYLFPEIIRVMDLKKHWDQVYRSSPEEKLGWFETNPGPMISLIEKTGLDRSARILNVGAGSTTLIDELLQQGYSKIIATDISEVALKNLEARVGSDKVNFIVDDLTDPVLLSHLEPVDLWIDRAVLHFLTRSLEQDTYFELLRNKLSDGGFVILAEYSLSGAEKCSGLPVYRYSVEMLSNSLGNGFELIDSFNYNYTMPSGQLRPYIYTLYKRKA